MLRERESTDSFHGMWAYLLTPQALETVFRFPFPKHLVEECVDLSSELRRRIFKCLVEEADIWWWKVANQL